MRAFLCFQGMAAPRPMGTMAQPAMFGGMPQPGMPQPGTFQQPAQSGANDPFGAL